MHLPDHILTLIIRHLSKQSSGADEAALQDWLAEDPAHKHAFDRVQRIWQNSENPLRYKIDVEAQWERFQQRHFSDINMQKHREAPRSGKVIWRYAAAVLLLLSVGISSLWFSGSTQYKTAAHERLLVHLGDGSELMLSENTRLSVPRTFNWFGRTLSLEGEALFQVAKNPEKPFEVFGPKTTTRVLGTAFRLRASETENSIVLSEGKVAYWANNGQDTLLLSPGQAATFEHNTLRKAFTETKNPDAWLTGSYTFENESLFNVLAALQDYYGFNLDVHELEAEVYCRFSGSFYQQTQKEAIEELALAMGMKYYWQANTLHLQKLNCK